MPSIRTDGFAFTYVDVMCLLQDKPLTAAQVAKTLGLSGRESMNRMLRGMASTTPKLVHICDWLPPGKHMKSVALWYAGDAPNVPRPRAAKYKPYSPGLAPIKPTRMMVVLAGLIKSVYLREMTASEAAFESETTADTARMILEYMHTKKTMRHGRYARRGNNIPVRTYRFGVGYDCKRPQRPDRNETRRALRAKWKAEREEREEQQMMLAATGGRPLPSRNSTGYVGVYRSDNGKRFIAKIIEGGKTRNLGTHDTAEEAGRAYMCAHIARYFTSRSFAIDQMAVALASNDSINQSNSKEKSMTEDTNVANAETAKITERPTIGRRVWYRPSKWDTIGHSNADRLNQFDERQPMDGGVVYVNSDRNVNLVVTDHAGVTHPRLSVPLLQGDDTPPEGSAYAEWMPYQKAKAALGGEVEKVFNSI